MAIIRDLRYQLTTRNNETQRAGTLQMLDTYLRYGSAVKLQFHQTREELYRTDQADGHA